MKYFSISKQKGFSLVELSVVLTIIGITLAGALDLATNKTESDRITETNKRLDAIEEALKIYVINYQRLPCPADITASLNSSAAGAAGTPSSTGCTASIYHNTTNGSYLYEGAVPTKTLGIPDKMMADDWDRRFTYIVDYRFANSSATATCHNYLETPVGSGAQMCFKNTTITSSATDAKDTTDITIFDTGSVSQRANDAVYVIISHGKNGFGAFPYVGSATQLAASTNADEISNAATSNATLDANFVQADTTTVFDDIVRYKTKGLIIEGVGGVTDSTTCNAAADNVNDIAIYPATSSTTTNPCTAWNAGAHVATSCDNLATQINKFCLQP